MRRDELDNQLYALIEATLGRRFKIVDTLDQTEVVLTKADVMNLAYAVMEYVDNNVPGVELEEPEEGDDDDY